MMSTLTGYGWVSPDGTVALLDNEGLLSGFRDELDMVKGVVGFGDRLEYWGMIEEGMKELDNDVLLSDDDRYWVRQNILRHVKRGLYASGFTYFQWRKSDGVRFKGDLTGRMLMLKQVAAMWDRSPEWTFYRVSGGDIGGE